MSWPSAGSFAANCEFKSICMRRFYESFRSRATQSCHSIYEMFCKTYSAVGQQIKVDRKVETVPIRATFHSFIVIFQQSYPPRMTHVVFANWGYAKRYSASSTSHVHGFLWTPDWPLDERMGRGPTVEILAKDSNYCQLVLSMAMVFINLYADGENRKFLLFVRSPLDVAP